MASKKKANYACKSKVECLKCDKVILSENQPRYLNYTHKGLKSVKFRFYNDAKQPRLQFNSTRGDTNLNAPRGESNNNETLDNPDPTLTRKLTTTQMRKKIKLKWIWVSFLTTLGQGILMMKFSQTTLNNVESTC